MRICIHACEYACEYAHLFTCTYIYVARSGNSLHTYMHAYIQYLHTHTYMFCMPLEYWRMQRCGAASLQTTSKNELCLMSGLSSHQQSTFHTYKQTYTDKQTNRPESQKKKWSVSNFGAFWPFEIGFSQTNRQTTTEKQTNKHRQTDKQTNRHRHRHRQTNTDKQTNKHRQTDKQTHTNIQTNTYKHTNKHRQTDKQTQTNRQTNTDKHTNKHIQTYKQTQINRQTNNQTYLKKWSVSSFAALWPLSPASSSTCSTISLIWSAGSGLASAAIGAGPKPGFDCRAKCVL